MRSRGKRAKQNLIKQGQKVEVQLDAYPNQPLQGIVDSFSPATGAKFALLPRLSPIVTIDKRG